MNFMALQIITMNFEFPSPFSLEKLADEGSDKSYLELFRRRRAAAAGLRQHDLHRFARQRVAEHHCQVGCVSLIELGRGGRQSENRRRQRRGKAGAAQWFRIHQSRRRVAGPGGMWNCARWQTRKRTPVPNQGSCWQRERETDWRQTPEKQPR